MYASQRNLQRIYSNYIYLYVNYITVTLNETKIISTGKNERKNEKKIAYDNDIQQPFPCSL